MKVYVIPMKNDRAAEAYAEKHFAAVFALGGENSIEASRNFDDPSQSATVLLNLDAAHDPNIVAPPDGETWKIAE